MYQMQTQMSLQVTKNESGFLLPYQIFIGIIYVFYSFS